MNRTGGFYWLPALLLVLGVVPGVAGAAAPPPLLLPALWTLLLVLLELVLWSAHFWPSGFCFLKVATAVATWPLSCRFSQKVTWSRLMTIWSYGSCSSQPSFTK